MLSSQQVFTKSATHLLNQGKQALGKMDDARYRIGEKVGCALFPFTKVGYNKGRKIENQNIYNSDVQRVLGMNGVNVERDIDLIRDLQDIHDENEPRLWPKLLSEVAQTHGLRMVKVKLKDASVQV